MVASTRPQLRSGYQIEHVQRLRAAFRQYRRIVSVLPTGGGKTVVASWIIDSATKAKGLRVGFLAHRDELIDQASNKLDAFGVAHGVIASGTGSRGLDRGVQVASVQTLARRLDSVGEFDLLVVDECHHACAGSYRRIMERWPIAKVLGLTATPYRLDGQGLADHFDHMEVGAHVSHLIKAGWLVRTRTFAPPPPAALGEVIGLGRREVALDAADEVLNATAPMSEIVSTWQTRAAGRLTVAFCCTVAHAVAVAAAFRSAGVAAAALDADTPSGRRAEILGQLADGRLQVVANCALLTEGWDLPACSCAILARPTQSRALWRQMAGRIMRSCPGKDDGLILDHAGNCHRFGTPDEDDHYSLDDQPPAEFALDGQVLCSGCHALNSHYLYACGECGKPLPKGAKQAGEAGGSAVKKTGDETSRQPWNERQALTLEEARPMTEAERVLWYHGRLNEAEALGYKSGWAAHRYKERFGRFPPTQWATLPRQFEVHR